MASTKELEELFNTICHIIGEEPDDVKRKSRKRNLVCTRQVYFYFAKNTTKHTMSNIGRILEKDHATVLHGIRLVESAIERPVSYPILHEKFKKVSDIIHINLNTMKAKLKVREIAYQSLMESDLRDKKKMVPNSKNYIEIVKQIDITKELLYEVRQVLNPKQ